MKQERLKRLFEYKEGGLYRRVNAGPAKAGDRFGSIESTGRRQGRIAGKFYLEHRLIWLYHKGYLPEVDVDHINGDPLDNRIGNLREASHQCNMQNQKLRNTNTTGVPGVNKQYDKYRARLTVGKDYQMNLGSYNSILEAALARLTCEVQHPSYTCNAQCVTIKAVKELWPQFKGDRYFSSSRSF